MNNTGGISNPQLEIKSRITRLFEAQRTAYQAAPYPSAAERIHKLRALKKQIGRYQDLLCEALSSDFGFRHATESKLLDLLGSVLDAEHAITHTKRWMKPSRRCTELLFFSNSLQVTSTQRRGRSDRAVELPRLPRARATHRRTGGGQSGNDQNVGSYTGHARGPGANAR